MTPRLPPVFVLFIGVLATSISAILVRFAQNEAPSLAISTWRLVFATLILLPFAARKSGSEIRNIGGPGLRLALFAGVMLGVHFAGWITSLQFTSVASSVVLVTTTPLWVGLASPLILKEPLTRTIKVGIVLALVGSVLIGAGDAFILQNGRLVLQSAGEGSKPLLGNGLALVGAVSGAAYFMVGRLLRPRLSLLSYTTMVYGAGALFLLVSALATRTPLLGYSGLTYLLFLLMAIFPQLLGHSSYNYALAYLSAAYVSVAIISEPIGASILAYLIFGESPSTLVIIGAIFILFGIFIASQGRYRAIR